MGDFLDVVMRLIWINLLFMIPVIFILFFIFEDMSRIGAVLLGISLIGLAVGFAYQIQFSLMEFAKEFSSPAVSDKYRISQGKMNSFQNSANLFIWLVPFVTASLGTNILSNALTRGYTYRARWEAPGEVWTLLTAIVGLVGWVIRMLWILVAYLPSRILHKSQKTKIVTEAASEPVSEFHDRMQSRLLLRFLAELPHFQDASGHAVSMVDGTVVSLAERELFGDGFLNLDWGGRGSEPIRVDAARYIRLQIECAAKFSADVPGLHAKFNKLLERIYN